MLSVIVAVTDNGVIGLNNDMPWHLPEDLKRFKAITMGKPMIMGRKTFESLPGVLPGRPHIIISRQPDYVVPANCYLVADLAAAIQCAKNLLSADDSEIIVAGGAQIYRLALPMVDRIYLTELHIELQGDAYFPDLDSKIWKEVSRDDFSAPFAYSFVTYERHSAVN